MSNREPIFSPNIHEVSKNYFTGRTDDLMKIFELIGQGRCIGLYGERRSGKTLVLNITQEIINGNIEARKDKLIDKRLCNSLAALRQKLSNVAYKAIYVTLHGSRTEEELINKFIDGIYEAKITSWLNCSNQELENFRQQSGNGKLSEFLAYLQNKLSINNSSKLVVLMDEMELLGEHENSDSIAEIFCDENTYNQLIFVHTGSYLWRERVSRNRGLLFPTSKGSLFTHLAPHFLSSIDETDLKNYLLEPLQREYMKSLVSQMSGNKPLYAQFIGQALYELGNASISKDELEGELLEDDDITGQIEQNIYMEARLSDISKDILALLSYHPNVDRAWIKQRLDLGNRETIKSLRLLKQFGTVQELQVKTTQIYCINGEFIERYGQEICDDPAKPPKSLQEKLYQSLPWVMMVGFLLAAFVLYQFSYPSFERESINFDKSKVIIEVIAPKTLEVQEEGKLALRITSSSSMDALEIQLISEDIDYSTDKEMEDGNLIIRNIKPNSPTTRNINYSVLPNSNKTLFTQITILDEQQSFEIPRRPFPTQKYAQWVALVISIFGVALPEQIRSPVSKFLTDMFRGKK